MYREVLNTWDKRGCLGAIRKQNLLIGGRRVAPPQSQWKLGASIASNWGGGANFTTRWCLLLCPPAPPLPYWHPCKIVTYVDSYAKIFPRQKLHNPYCPPQKKLHNLTYSTVQMSCKCGVECAIYTSETN